MFISTRFKTFLFFLLFVIFSSNTTATVLDEFHYGYGGFSIDAGGNPSVSVPVSEAFEEYALAFCGRMLQNSDCRVPCGEYGTQHNRIAKAMSKSFKSNILTKRDFLQLKSVSTMDSPT